MKMKHLTPALPNVGLATILLRWLRKTRRALQARCCSALMREETFTERRSPDPARIQLFSPTSRVGRPALHRKPVRF